MCGDRGSRQQPAATAADQQRVQRTRLFDQFCCHRSLAGNHIDVIERRNQRCSCVADNLLGHHLAPVFSGVVAHHARAVTLGRIQLGLRCVRRHHDRRWHPKQSRREGHRLRVIAARVGDDAFRARLNRQRTERVVCAAKFEGAHPLQVLALQKDLCANHRIERA